MTRGLFSSIRYYKKRYDQAKENGLCARCRKNPARENKVTCGRCT